MMSSADQGRPSWLYSNPAHYRLGYQPPAGCRWGVDHTLTVRKFADSQWILWECDVCDRPGARIPGEPLS